MKIGFVPVTLVALLAVACAHESTNAGTTTTTAGREAAQPVNQHDVDAIAKARCERETTCDNVGPGRKYSTQDVCVAQVRADGQNDLTNANCPYGIDQTALNKCLADIRGERCDHPLDTLSRVSSCSTSSLCKR